MAPAKKRGRPPAGPDGERRAAMRHQISARLPATTYAQLKALSAVLQISQAEVITRAFDALEHSLAEPERRLITMMRKRDGK